MITYFNVQWIEPSKLRNLNEIVHISVFRCCKNAYTSLDTPSRPRISINRHVRSIEQSCLYK